jgi:hypothetical protein
MSNLWETEEDYQYQLVLVSDAYLLFVVVVRRHLQLAWSEVVFGLAMHD